MNDEHFARLRNMYLAAPDNEHFAPDISIYKGSATVSITARPKMFNHAGALDGETCMKALMDAAYYSVSSMVTDCVVALSDFHVHMLRSVTSGVVSAKGQVKYAGKDRYLAEAILSDASGEIVARGAGSFTRSGIQLIEEIGYRL